MELVSRLKLNLSRREGSDWLMFLDLKLLIHNICLHNDGHNDAPTSMKKRRIESDEKSDREGHCQGALH